jgi:P-type Mg2+ transporter
MTRSPHPGPAATAELPAGLTSAEARRRARQFGRNEIRPPRQRALLLEFLRRLRSPLILILLAASAVSALTGNVASFIIIVTIVLLGIGIDLAQEHRAGRAAEALRRRVQVHATVLRDARPSRIAVSHLVPGDVVLLGAGSVIPGDGVLLAANGLHVNEALLTGEPFPAAKSPSPGALRDDAVTDLFMGTSVVSGSGSMRIQRIGAATEIGKIALELGSEAPPTSFERGTHAFGLLIMRLTAFMVLFVLLVNAALHRPLLESFLFAVALAVGLTPELLPMIVSVTLSRGALRLAEQHVIVKRLAAIEGLGSMDVLCTDKTGTLTEAKIRLEACTDHAGNPSEHVLELAWLNSAMQAGIRNPLDEAILERQPTVAAGWSRLDEVPFDFERRRVAVLLGAGDRRLLVVKGAPEEILALTSRYEAAGGGEARDWDDGARAAAMQRLEALGREGLRVLGVAHKAVTGDRAQASDESGLVFAGFASFLDPPKAGAGQALAALAAIGVQVKILTGDNELVTGHVCARLGLPATGILTGAQIERMDDTALAARVDSTMLFCRVNPAQKNRIVQTLKARGHVTGYLGDGINDAPALHSADVSLSVENAVDVAREAADLILLRRDLGVLHGGVIEGRRTFVNIRKYLLMGTSSNFGNMFSMAGAALFLPFLPLLPTQILLNNLLYDISEVPIPLDGVDPDELRSPQRWDIGFIRNFMWTLGPVSSLFDFLTFYVLLAVLDAGEALFRTGWFIESLATQVLVIFVIRTRGSPFAGRPVGALVFTSLAVVTLAIALPFTPLGPRLGFEAPPAAFFAVLAVLVGAYLALAEIAKRAFYRYLAPR